MMIVCDHCQRYATSTCQNCGYFSDLYGSITGEYSGGWVILAYRFVSRVLLPFLLYKKWNRPRQYIKGAYYPWEHQRPVDNQKPSDNANLPF